MARNRILVCFPPGAPSAAYVRGYNARELLTGTRKGKAPMYAPRLRCWATTPSTAADVIAVCQYRGIEVEEITEEHLARLAGLEWDGVRTEAAHAAGRLL